MAAPLPSPPRDGIYVAPTKLYVGNLSVNINVKDLRKLFQKFGTVSDVDVVGTFAFVVMPNEVRD